MTDNKSSLYEILGVTPSATTEQIKAAHRRQSLQVMSGQLGLSREACDARLQALDAALATLSDPEARANYDREQGIAPATITWSIAPVEPREERALRIADAVADIHRQQLAVSAPPKLDFGEVSHSLGATGRALKTIMRIAILVLVLMAVIRMGQNVLAHRKPGGPMAPPPDIAARAEEKLRVQEYFKRTGVRVANAAEARALDDERHRAETAAREAAFNERRQREASERFFEESRAMAEREEYEQRQAAAEARYEAERRQRETRAPRGEEE